MLTVAQKAAKQLSTPVRFDKYRIQLIDWETVALKLNSKAPNPDADRLNSPETAQTCIAAHLRFARKAGSAIYKWGKPFGNK